ncbi:hypothetical protein [Nocardia sp. NBC_00511]|uniref:hypothetical protein n=1 Tax=Nocardia sp. NBC_00511 TaxID=2903591 RepID=UPI0030DF82A3
MPDREALDRHRRLQALALAVETHHHGQPDDVLSAASSYLDWLRRPTPAATLTLRVGNPEPK